MTEKQEKKTIDKFVYEFEEKVKYKQKADSNITFELYQEYKISRLHWIIKSYYEKT